MAGSEGTLAAHFRRQSADCASLGSPFYGRLLELAAQDVERAGAITEILAGHRHRPGDDAVPLRLLGAVHRLVLAGDAPDLTLRYPSVGGDGDADAAWPALLAVLDDHREAVLDGLTRAPQTNEPGRAAGLIGALHHLVAALYLPIRLLEIGASGGLNLRADLFRVTTQGDPDGLSAAGPTHSPLVLTEGWSGAVPRVGEVRIVDRHGCDVAPVDPVSADGALTLQSYVWPDQAARWTRLQGALAIARTTPADVIRAGAGDFLADLSPAEGVWTVVWHSVMWQYLDPAEQRQVLERLARAGALATPDSPVAHVALEPYGPRFLVTARTWPDVGLGAGRELLGGDRAVMGVGAPHGVPVNWL